MSNHAFYLIIYSCISIMAYFIHYTHLYNHLPNKHVHHSITSSFMQHTKHNTLFMLCASIKPSDTTYAYTYIFTITHHTTPFLTYHTLYSYDLYMQLICIFITHTYHKLTSCISIPLAYHTIHKLSLFLSLQYLFPHNTITHIFYTHNLFNYPIIHCHIYMHTYIPYS